MLGHEDGLIVDLGLHVGCLEGGLSMLVGLEADEACSVLLDVDGC